MWLIVAWLAAIIVVWIYSFSISFRFFIAFTEKPENVERLVKNRRVS
jgi:hypothetical protein